MCPCKISTFSVMTWWLAFWLRHQELANRIVHQAPLFGFVSTGLLGDRRWAAPELQLLHGSFHQTLGDFLSSGLFHGMLPG